MIQNINTIRFLSPSKKGEQSHPNQPLLIEISLPEFALAYAKPIRPTHVNTEIRFICSRIETQKCTAMKARGEVGKRGDWPIGFPYASSACDGPLL